MEAWINPHNGKEEILCPLIPAPELFDDHIVIRPVMRMARKVSVVISGRAQVDTGSGTLRLTGRPTN